MGASFKCFLPSGEKSVLGQGSGVPFSWGLRGLGFRSLALRAYAAHTPGGVFSPNLSPDQRLLKCCSVQVFSQEACDASY